MTAADIIALIIIFVLLFGAVRYMIVSRKKRGCGGCSGCLGCNKCSKRADK
ncbi:MAG: FeoB-associated Cys-rich membrane protein [Oscillospiraceae bacterium]|nr:FeoB-associated Cys-rich membrane protein [Oscillospiraceae bacterium]MDD7279548.1 FeoB-associated Cys-rich membrane protein [Oscillospiraceae bacterium]MDY2864680.1 FeoB-associated Cys-rich membrane protein [Oscillospiraceae bacterium]